MSYAFGSIVLTRFPFTDLSASKVRPALVISRDNHSSDVVLAFITSNLAGTQRHALRIDPARGNGLKVPSLVRFDKVVTLESRVIAGRIGDADRAFLKTASPVFFGVFGFDAP